MSAAAVSQVVDIKQSHELMNHNTFWMVKFCTVVRISDKVVIQDPYRLPGPPGKPKVLERTKGSMLVSWTPPLDNGGSPITGYWLEKREEGSTYWSRVSRAPITKVGLKGVEFNVPRLIEGVRYQFRAMAINAAGIGPPSEPSDPAIAGDPICKYASISETYRGQCH